MNLYTLRSELQAGKSIYDLPLRVTFYARVSTDMDAQLNSLDNQIEHYTELIQNCPNWTYFPGYIDEGISGGTTKRRDDFLRMINDAQAGLFDLIITKEISRFSRSTLDSILYTQELLRHNVGVLFQNDNINTLDPDSEFRLVVMSGVAQDELRKLSDRVKFGFRQSIKNGRILGNDSLYGYDKKKCVMTINEDEAALVRIIFDLYANQGLGTRRISQHLLDMGYTSRCGNAFNTLTIRNILTNPKYKGWYCGNKSRSVDYRTKEKVFLDESEWITYPDPSVPAIVPEELWDRANALYKQRRSQFMEHSCGASYHNRYAYSGKIYCEEHSTTYHRQTYTTKAGVSEIWECKVYRYRGRAACSSPQIKSVDLDQVLSQLFTKMLIDPDTLADTIIRILQSATQNGDYGVELQHKSNAIAQTKQRLERLLDLYLSAGITLDEYNRKHDALQAKLQVYEAQHSALECRKAYGHGSMNYDTIRSFLLREISFQNGIHSNLVATILERIVVKKSSTPEAIQLQIHLRGGTITEHTIRRDK